MRRIAPLAAGLLFLLVVVHHRTKRERIRERPRPRSMPAAAAKTQPEPRVPAPHFAAPRVVPATHADGIALFKIKRETLPPRKVLVHTDRGVYTFWDMKTAMAFARPGERVEMEGGSLLSYTVDVGEAIDLNVTGELVISDSVEVYATSGSRVTYTRISD